ncbi:hypothetical protein PTSG_12095 [Salpingoeca rosetta]|uniref:Uncharacterized protein n=1 Tax=Salpingoeca rosetta (strain ATCC 50818 / BSB-021) TaxID=946362 RepID=F2U779_SALR5|nr:uncharacterized protein PTSG_12095 [Salpingoeca rosetta]EGD83296.1 hypothetical protein PTSG_12095 [Salpingoeca rosetta]|eukprot:XP_004994800.1 hypothetical protein PTSG_12095 [Salpingoeca rosetta]
MHQRCPPRLTPPSIIAATSLLHHCYLHNHITTTTNSDIHTHTYAYTSSFHLVKSLFSSPRLSISPSPNMFAPQISCCINCPPFLCLLFRARVGVHVARLVCVCFGLYV